MLFWDRMKGDLKLGEILLGLVAGVAQSSLAVGLWLYVRLLVWLCLLRTVRQQGAMCVVASLMPVGNDCDHQESLRCIAGGVITEHRPRL